MSGLSLWFVHGLPEPPHFDGNVPQDVGSIFFHNLSVAGTYALPFLGPFFYVWGFSYTYIVIGLSFSVLGFWPTLAKLIHLPLEVFALTIPLSLKKKHTRHKRLMLEFFGVVLGLLLIAALIEIGL